MFRPMQHNCKFCCIKYGDYKDINMSKAIPIKNKDEINLIKNYYKKNCEWSNLLMFTLSINTGIDLIRLLNLKVKDVKDKDFIACDNKKIVPLSEDLKELIKIVINGKKTSDLLFSNKSGNKYDRSVLFRQFKSICSELGLSDKYSVSSWRRTFAYHYYEKYKDLAYLMWLFNQSTVNVAFKFFDVEENMNFQIKEGVCL